MRYETKKTAKFAPTSNEVNKDKIRSIQNEEKRRFYLFALQVILKNV